MSQFGIVVFVGFPLFYRLRAIVIATGAVTTLAGSGSAGSAAGTGTAASFSSPSSVAISPDGAFALVADSANSRIRHVVVSTGVVTTLAGSPATSFADGTGTAAGFASSLYDVAISPDGATQEATNAEYQEVHARLMATLGELGMEKIEAVGTEFDYNLHMALQTVPSTDYDEDIVCAEMQPGYTCKGQLVRAARLRALAEARSQKARPARRATIL